MSVVAIDLGASALRIAVVANGAARAVAMPDGTGEIPAAVSFTGATAQVGRSALGDAVTSPATTVRDVKRLLGARADEADDLRAASGLRVQARGNGIEIAVGGERKSPIAIAVALCEHALALAEREVGESATGAVFTHPLPDPRGTEDALLSIAHQLGLASVTTVSDPVAAAAGACADGQERVVWVVDVGASHTTLAAVRVRPGAEPEALHVVGEPIGGHDVDLALGRRLVGDRLPQIDPGLREMVRQQCEAMKIELSSASSTSSAMPEHLAQILGLRPAPKLDPAGLAEAAAPLLRAVEVCAERVRGAARLSPDTELYLLGGMTRTALVRTFVERVFGTRARVARAPGVLALGAARVALVAPPTRSPAKMQARGSWRAPRLATPAPSTFTATATPAPPTFAASTPTPAPTATPAPPTFAASTPTPAPAATPDRPATSDVAPRREPPARAVSASAISLNEGRVKNPTTPAEMLEIPLARPIRQADLDPIALPLLLLLTSNARRTGTLTLRMDGAPALTMPFLGGRAMLTSSESQALTACFRRPAGAHAFAVGEPEVSGRRLEHRMAPLVADGLRRLMRGFDPAEMVAALGERIDLTPSLSPSQQQAAGRLGLTDPERRLLSFAFNGRGAARTAIEYGGSKQTALSLLLLLTLYDLVEWRAVSTAVQPSLRDQLEERARQFDVANHFQVLGVHWSALEDEIHAAYQKLRGELAPGKAVAEIAPEACRRMLARAEEAYACLHDAQRRGEYRRLTYSDVDFGAARDLLEGKQRAVSLREDGAREVARLERTMEEIARSKRKPKTLG